MEGNNQVGSSSLANDLFGAKHSSINSASNSVLSSIFSAPFAVHFLAKHDKSTYCPTYKYSGNEHKHHGSMSLDTVVEGDKTKNKEGESNFSSSKETCSIFQERPEPCPLSSSLYYGGKYDMYVESSGPHTSGPYSDYKRDNGVDDPSGNDSSDALTGNWWQGRFIIETVLKDPETLEQFDVNLGCDLPPSVAEAAELGVTSSPVMSIFLEL